MAVEGTLDVFKLPEILQMISQQQKTGILTVQGEMDIIAVSFLRGEIVTVDSLNQTQEEGLSQILIRDGLLTSAQFARASSEHQSSGQRLFDLLVEHNYIQRDALLKALRTHANRLLDQLLRWEKGEFKFYSGDEVPYEDGFVPITVEEVVVRGAQGAPRRAGPVAVPSSGPRPVSPISPLSPIPPAVPPAAGPVGSSTGTRPGLRVVRRDGAPPDRPAAAPIPFPSPGAEAPETTGHFRKMKVEAHEEVRAPLLVKGLAALLAVLMLAVLVLRSGAMVIPFPWQADERAALAHEQRNALYLKIDRAAKTWFLLEGRFPERLDQLSAAGFLSAGDLRDPQGYPLQYVATEESYALQPTRDGKAVAGAESTEAITGNFLLDPGFLAVPEESAAQPLVLLD